MSLECRGWTLAVVACLAMKSSFGQCNQWDNLMAMPYVVPAGVAFDSSGNRYVGGSFTSTSLTLGSVTLNPKGMTTAFLVKFDCGLNAAWGLAIGNDGIDVITQVGVNSKDQVVVAGRMQSSSLTIGTTTLNRSGSGNIFLALFSNDGQVLWAKQSTGGDMPTVTDLKVGVSDEILVAGNFVDTLAIAGSDVPGFSGYDMYVVSLSSLGVVNWVRSFGNESSASPDYVLGIDAGGDGSVFLTGFFESPTLAFGSFVLSANTFSENYFVVKLSDAGTVLWARGTQGPANAGGYDVAVNSLNEVFVTGRYFFLDVNFDGLTIPNAGDGDIFVAKYASDGQILTLRNFGTSSFESGFELEINRLDEVFLGGFFYGGELSIDGFTMTKESFAADGFVVKFNSSLEAICQSQISGDSELHIRDLKVDPGGNAWVLAASDLGFGATSFGSSFTVDDMNISSMLARLPDDDDTNPGSGSALVPNVVTPNGDKMNDFFVLPASFGNPSVTIINRWGSEVFSEKTYANNWPSEQVSAGVYYYHIQGHCPQVPIRGSILVIR